MQSDYKQRIIDFFNSRTTYDSEGKGHPENAKRLLDFVPVQPGQTVLNNYGSTQIEKEFYPRGNPLLNLSEAEKQLLQAEYTKAIDQLIAEGGVWQEAINLYVKAWK